MTKKQQVPFEKSPDCNQYPLLTMKNTIAHDNKILSLVYRLIKLDKFDQAYELICNYISKCDSFSINFLRLQSYICLETNRFEEAYDHYINFESQTVTSKDSVQYKIDSYKQTIHPRSPIEAIKLFKVDRFDILAKITFLNFYYKKINSTWGEEIYATHLHVWNGIKEKKPIKKNLKEYIESFIKISKNVLNNNFDFKKSPILLDNKNHVLDGSHRLASAIYFNTKVRYSYIHENDAPEYVYKSALKFINNKYELQGGACPFYVLTPGTNYQSLKPHHKTYKNSKLEQKFSDYMALEYLKLKKRNIYSIILYPSTNSTGTKEAANIISQYADIIYYKKLTLEYLQGRNLIIQAYLEEDWIGNIHNKFAGSDIQYKKCFTNQSDTRLFLIETKDLNTALYIKKELRDFFKIGKHSIHTSDSYLETWRISTSLLNNNTLSMLKKMKYEYAYNFYKNFSQFKHWAHINNIQIDEICITGSSILSLHNIRDANDIDYIHRDSVQYADTKIIKSHFSEKKYYSHTFDDIIFNPENHFYFEGIKFASLNVITKLKSNRREQKDLKDLNLIEQSISKDKQFQPYSTNKLCIPESELPPANRHRPQPTQRPLIAQFCMQDYGGAGTAALRLHSGLLSFGVKSTFYTHNIRRWEKNTTPLLIKSTSEHSKNTIISDNWRAFELHNQKIIAKYPHRPKGLETFTDTWAATHLSDVPGVPETDIIHLHWVAGTVDISREVDFLKNKKIVWTLHDMNAFTGGCHYSAACQKYEQQCGNCPQLGSGQENDLSRQIWKRKMMTYKQLDMTVVAPSQWLAKCAQNSSLLSRFPIHVIPNGLPTDIFKPYPQSKIRESLQIPKDAFVILFGADSVANVRKGFIHLVRALEHIKSLVPDNQIAIATFGQHAQEAVQQLGFPTYTFNYVDKESELALIYSLADVTVIPSLEDNLPNVVLESLACGTPVVGFNVGGIPDMIEHKCNGYLAPVGDYKELAIGIHWIMDQLKMGCNLRIKSRETALRMYNSPLQAKSYQNLYDQILKKTHPENQ